MKKEEAFSLIAASKVQEADVYNTGGDHAGDVDELMINKTSGKITYAIITFSGFLGMGQDRYALPRAALKYGTRHAGYVVGVTDEVLNPHPR